MAEASRRDPVRSLANRIVLTISGEVVACLLHRAARGSHLRPCLSQSRLGLPKLRRVRHPVPVRHPVAMGPATSWPAGRFTLRTKGRDYQLERPEIIHSHAGAAAVSMVSGGSWSQGIQHFVWAHQ